MQELEDNMTNNLIRRNIVVSVTCYDACIDGVTNGHIPLIPQNGVHWNAIVHMFFMSTLH